MPPIALPVANPWLPLVTANMDRKSSGMAVAMAMNVAPMNTVLMRVILPSWIAESTKKLPPFIIKASPAQNKTADKKNSINFLYNRYE